MEIFFILDKIEYKFDIINIIDKDVHEKRSYREYNMKKHNDELNILVNKNTNQEKFFLYGIDNLKVSGNSLFEKQEFWDKRYPINIDPKWTWYNTPINIDPKWTWYNTLKYNINEDT